MKHTCILNTDVEPTAHQGVDTPKVQLGKPVGFIGVTYRTMGEELLRGARRLTNSCFTETQHE